MTVTEVATIPLIAGSDVGDPNSAASKSLADLVAAISQGDGFQGAQWGTIEEDPSTLQLFGSWESIEAHETFKKSNQFASVVNGLKAIGGGKPNIVHVEFSSPQGAQKTAFGAPITELLTIYATPEEAEQVGSDAQEFLESVKRDAKGLVGVDSGWIVEEVEHEKLGEGKKGKAYYAALGWQSLEAHVANRDTQSFKDNIHLLRDNVAGIEVHHVKVTGG